MSKSQVHRLVQAGEIRSHSSAIKPFLTEENMKKRLEFCLLKLNPRSIGLTPTFDAFYNYVHIDEKWFFLSKTTQKYYLHPAEIDPVRTCKSKRFITKVMFLTAVARPRFGRNEEVLFDGKIGIFPFTVIEAAKRASKNRVAGVLETKPMLSITKDITKAFLIEKVVPAIKSKWPIHGSKTIFIQQDNATPHIKSSDPEFKAVAKADGFDIHLTCQPTNSPDLNILDLGFFNAIQSLQH
ncbi:unnamed protein product [Cuscuta epithymum]|uniref:Transposase n=1 Tax=Cuscuta epithymum TaxID=186058 RepID=A0AAV0DIB5_9ASTE|nr:unnamed protein product [Cuscuta epithymum]